jgi:hypothetical protein
MKTRKLYESSPIVLPPARLYQGNTAPDPRSPPDNKNPVKYKK